MIIIFYLLCVVGNTSYLYNTQFYYMEINIVDVSGINLVSKTT